MRTSIRGGFEEARRSATDRGDAAGGDPVERPVRRPFDNVTLRWMVAATLAFWLVVYAAGRSLF